MSRVFSNVIKAADRLHEFNFRRLSGSDSKYHVDVPDGRGNRIIFNMFKDTDGWKTNDTLPNWITNIQNLLGDAIEQQEAETSRG